MEQEYLLRFKEGMLVFLDYANWAFIAFFMVWTIILNMTVGKSVSKSANKVSMVLKTVPKAYWVILQGVVLAGIWAYFFRMTSREDFAGLFFSITISMVIYKMGLHKFIESRSK